MFVDKFLFAPRPSGDPDRTPEAEGWATGRGPVGPREKRFEFPSFLNNSGTKGKKSKNKQPTQRKRQRKLFGDALGRLVSGEWRGDPARKSETRKGVLRDSDHGCQLGIFSAKNGKFGTF